MSLAVSQQLRALRTPPELRASRDQELDHHITQNILRYLDDTLPKAIASSGAKDSHDLLELLDPADDTLPYLYILLAQINAVAGTWREQYVPKTLGPTGGLWQKVLYFLLAFDPVEVRYAGSKWRELMDVFDFVTSFGKTISVMGYMAQALLRLDPTLGTFTSTHLLFVRLCLRTRSLREACQILDYDFHSFPGPSSEHSLPCAVHRTSNAFITSRFQLSGKISVNDVLEYYLLGAIVYIGLGEWRQALYQVEHVLAVPSNGIAHAFMVEAYKKWFLLKVLLDGQVSSSPRSANPAAMKILKSLSRAYEAIIEAFKQDDPKKLQAEAFEGQEIWQQDGNTGLIRQILERHKERSVIQMGSIYAAVPLSAVSTHVNLSKQETQVYVASLIRRGILNARIEQSTTTPSHDIVRFFGGDVQGTQSEEQLRLALTQQKFKIEALAVHVEEADRRLGLTREYLDHAKRTRKATDQDRNSPEHDGVDAPPFGAGALSDDDESVMEDVA